MINVTQGDTATLTLYAKSGVGEFHDLTGASFETKIKKTDGTFLTLANSVHTADGNQTTNKGKFTLALSAADTAALAAGVREIVTKVTQTPSVVHFRAKVLTVKKTNPEE